MSELQAAIEQVRSLKDSISQDIFGQKELIEETLACLLAGGHILMTGAPGLAKTTLVRVFSEHLNLHFGRLQFTPDLLPSDILGSEILNIDPESGKRHFQFVKGPVFVNLLLADEINRASPRTQSALLEAMQERNVTIAGKTHKLDFPFMVFATQNPYESEGTFVLPEAQLDRFLLHAHVDYPDAASEKKILEYHAQNKLIGEKSLDLEPSSNKEKIQVDNLIQITKKISIDDVIIEGISQLVRSTRPDDPTCPNLYKDALWYGAGPRAGISLVSVSRAMALIDGETRVSWHHVTRMAKPVLRHRIKLSAQALRDSLTEDQVIDDLVEQLKADSMKKLLP